MLTGWHYWWNRYLGWIPVQPCRICWRWYWGGLPMTGWRAQNRSMIYLIAGFLMLAGMVVRAEKRHRRSERIARMRERLAR